MAVTTGPSKAGPTVGAVGEFSLIAQFTAGLPSRPEVLIGPGDDAAALAIDPPVLTSVDVLVEGVHFLRTWSSPAEIGRKAVAVNVADIEAMGGRAVAIVVGLSMPAELPLDWVSELAAGIRAECERAEVALVGGDLAGGPVVTISVTVLGALDGRTPVRRDGARPGQIVAVAGRLGWAAAGLAVLRRGFRSPRAAVAAQRVPEVPYGQGRLAAVAGATAMIDVSDGLLADLGHVAQASGVVVDLQLTAIEIPEVVGSVAAATGIAAAGFVLTGGEDHALVACFPAAAELPAGWRPIGRTRELAAEAEPAVLVDGAVWAGAQGWDHFAGVGLV